MRKRWLLTLAFVAAAGTARAEPGHPFGLGVVLGEPTGLTAKLYLASPVALQFGLGWVDEFNDYYSGLYINVDVLWHPVVLARRPEFTLPFYIGVGGRILDNHWHYYYAGNSYYDEHDTHVGVRVPFGLLMDFSRVPLDLYLELAVVVDLFYFDQYDPYDDHRRVELNGGIGVRYYF
jgi:hypothetical protein